MTPLVTLTDTTADDVDLAAPPDGRELWIAWSSATLSDERVRLARLRAGEAAPHIVRVQLTDAETGGDACHAFRPRLAVAGDDVLLAAAILLDDGRTRLDVVRLDRATGRLRESWHCDEPGASVFDIALAPHPTEPGAVWLACDVRRGRRTHLRLGILSPGGAWRDVELPRAQGPAPWRRTPALATGGDHTWLAWVEGPDLRTGPGHIHLTALSPAGDVFGLARPDPHPAHQEAPAVTVTADGHAVVAWHTGADHADADDPMRWLRAWHVATDGTTRQLPVPERPALTQATCGEDQGWEFPSLCVDPSSDTIVLAGRSAHGFHATRLTLDPRSSAPPNRESLSAPGWGGRGRRSALAAFDARIVFGRREPEGVVVSPGALSPSPSPVGRGERVSADSRSSVAGRGERSAKVAMPPVSSASRDGSPPLPTRESGLPDDRAVRRDVGEADRGGGGPKNPIYFGDLHQHSVHSDALGAPEEIVRAARDRYHHDFTALTDHELFCRRAIGPATWAFQCQVADAFDEPGRFVVLHAYEFTGARLPGPGHKCVYFRPGRVPERLPDKDIESLQRMLRAHDAIALPHHLGFTGADVEHHDPVLQPCFEICSVHGVYERDDLETRFAPRDDVFLPGQSIADCLAAGLRFGFVGGTDSHGLLWHHGISERRDPWRCGLTAVVDAELTRDGILQALVERRCYATTGARIRLDVRFDGHPMGSQLPAGTTGTLTIDVQGTDTLESVTVVTAHTETRHTTADRTFAVRTQHTLTPDDWLYVRVTQRDGEMAWTSPVVSCES